MKKTFKDIKAEYEALRETYLNLRGEYLHYKKQAIIEAIAHIVASEEEGISLNKLAELTGLSYQALTPWLLALTNEESLGDLTQQISRRKARRCTGYIGNLIHEQPKKTFICAILDENGEPTGETIKVTRQMAVRYKAR